MRIVRDLPGLPGEYRVYNADDERDRKFLIARSQYRRTRGFDPTKPEVEERDFTVRPYGSIPGVEVMADRPDVYINPSDFKERLTAAHEMKQLPVYHQYASWAPKDSFRYNQDGLGYCWTWSGTGCMMDCRAVHKLPTVYLSPVSMGFLVGWANRGNYLESFIRGARERGVCPATDDAPVNSTNRSSRYWEQYEAERKKYRLDMVWEINTRSGDSKTVQECLSCLVYGVPIYIAYNWWGHALNATALFWDESKRNNVIWGIRNSHNESDIILLEGSRGVPDEAYGFVSMIEAAA